MLLLICFILQIRNLSDITLIALSSNSKICKFHKLSFPVQDQSLIFFSASSILLCGFYGILSRRSGPDYVVLLYV